MKSRLIATCITAAALSLPAVGFSADTMPKDTMPKDQVSRDSATPKKEGGAVSDSMITTKIKAEFAKDKAVSMTSIRVDTDKGVVTLGGTAKSKAEAEKAAMIARNIEGVTLVRNDIKVQAN